MLSMINVAALVNIANISVSAKYGFASIFFIIASSLMFFIPIALISAELATGWPQRGGVYIWVKEALGDNFGFLAIWLQWIENVIWYPTALSFAAVSFAYIFDPTLAQNKTFIMSSIIIVFWLSTIVNFFGMTISGLKNQYILENCEFKAGEKIYYMHHTNNYKCGIIHSITYNLDSAGFSYNIKRLNKGFTESDSYRYPVNINPNGGSQAIKKA